MRVCICEWIVLLRHPRACAAQKPCALHVSLHGCDNPWFVQAAQARTLSFNRWAEANDIVVMFPHLAGVACFDAYGHTGPLYDTKEGLQMQAIRKMVEAVSGV